MILFLLIKLLTWRSTPCPRDDSNPWANAPCEPISVLPISMLSCPHRGHVAMSTFSSTKNLPHCGRVWRAENLHIYLQYLRKRHQTFKKYLRHLEAKGKGTKSSLERREHMHLRIWKRKGGGKTDKWRPEEKICWNSSCYFLFSYFAGSFAGYTLVCYLLVHILLLDRKYRVVFLWAHLDAWIHSMC